MYNRYTISVYQYSPKPSQHPHVLDKNIRMLYEWKIEFQQCKDTDHYLLRIR